MRLEQILAGAPNDFTYVVTAGHVGTYRFIAYASGPRLVILTSKLERIQVIERAPSTSGASSHSDILCVDCCDTDGKIVVSHGDEVVIYRPRCVPLNPDQEDGGLRFEWVTSSSMKPKEGTVHSLSWDSSGGRLLLGTSSSIELWCAKGLEETAGSGSAYLDSNNVEVDLVSEDDTTYVPVWSTSVAAPIFHLAYSPDGRVFVSAAKHDRVPKIWFLREKQFSQLIPKGFASQVQYDFIYLPHPKPVTSCSWRRGQTQTDKEFTANVLLTSCKDNVCRLWAETRREEPMSFYNAGVICLSDHYVLKKFSSEPFILHWLNTKELYETLHKRQDEENASKAAAKEEADVFKDPITKPSAPLQPQSERPPRRSASSPAISSLAKIAEMATGSSSRHSKGGVATAAAAAAAGDSEGLSFRSGSKYVSSTGHATPYARTEARTILAPPNSGLAGASSQNDARKRSDQWPDLVFCVRPDGALVCWRIDYLDAHPRRVARISLSSRATQVFPVNDAVKPLFHVMVYPDLDNATSALLTDLTKPTKSPFDFAVRRPLPLALICHHSSGVLARWRVNFEEKSAFSQVATVDSIARCSGHRRCVIFSQRHPHFPCLLTIGANSNGAEVLVWQVSTVPGVRPLYNYNDTLCEVGRMDLPPSSFPIAASTHSSHLTASSLPCTWIPSERTLVMLMATNKGIEVFSFVRPDALSPESFVNSPSLISIGILEGSKDHPHISSMLVHSCRASPTEESFWIFARERDNPNMVTIWSVIIQPPLRPTNTLNRALHSGILNFPKPAKFSSRLISQSTPVMLPESITITAMDILNSAFTCCSHGQLAPTSAVVALGCSDGIIRFYSTRDALATASSTTAPPEASSASGALAPPLVTPTAPVSSPGVSSPLPLPKSAASSAPSPTSSITAVHLEHSNCTFHPIYQFDTAVYGGHVGNDAQPVRVISCTSSGRIACAYGSDASSTTEDVVVIWEHESSGSAFRVEDVINLTARVTAIDWINSGTSSNLLAVANSHQIGVYCQTNKNSRGGWQLLSTTNIHDRPYPISTLAWCHDGVLVATVDSEAFVFSKWVASAKPAPIPVGDLKEVDNISLRSFDAALHHSSIALASHNLTNAGDPVLSTIFERMDHINGVLPQYHPQNIFYLLHQGKYNTVGAILKSVYVALKKVETSKSLSKPRSTTSLTNLLRNAWEGRKKIDRVRVTPVQLSVLEASKAQNLEKAKVDKTSLFTARPQTTATSDDATASDSELDDPLTLSDPQSKHLLELITQFQVEDLDSTEQIYFAAMVETYASIVSQSGGLDDCGLRFYASVKLFTYFLHSLPPKVRPKSLSTADYAWGLHSEAQEKILEMCPTIQDGAAGDPWGNLRALGAGYWIYSMDTLKKQAEKVAKARYQASEDPLDAALFYIALKKVSLLRNLFKLANNTRMYAFFENDFSEDRWQEAALKNAYALLSKQKFELCAAFFLLGGDLKACINICIRNLSDPQLALVVCRLHEGDSSPAVKDLVESQIIPLAEENGDPFLVSVAKWLLKDYAGSLRSLASPSASSLNKDSEAATLQIAAAPAVLNLSCYVANRTQVKALDAVPLELRNGSLFYRAAYEYSQTGMPLLALNTLSDLRSSPLTAILKGSQTTSGGGAASGAKQEPKKDDKKKADLINKGTFDMGAFDMGFDEFASSESEEEEEVQEDTTASDGAVQDLSHLNVENHESLSRPWRLGLAMQLVSHNLRYIGVGGRSWEVVAGMIQDEVNHAVRVCCPEDYSDSAEVRGLEGSDQSGVYQLLVQYCSLHAFPEAQCELLSTLAPGGILQVLRDLTQQILDYCVSIALPSPPSWALKPIVMEHLMQMTKSLSNGLHQLVSNALTPEAIPSIEFLIESSIAVYCCLFETLHLQRDTAGLLTLMAHPPSDLMWQRICGPGVTNASLSAAMLSKCTTTLRNGPSLMSYFTQGVSDTEFEAVDSLADLEVDERGPADIRKVNGDAFEDDPFDESRSPTAPSSPMATPTKSLSRATSPKTVGVTPSEQAAYRWALLELIMSQFVLVRLRKFVEDGGIDFADLSRLSPRLYRLFVVLEQRIAFQQSEEAKLPVAEKLVKAVSSGTTPYPTQSIFKIRSLLEPSANPFLSTSPRRLWHYLLSQKELQGAIEHYVYRDSAQQQLRDAQSVGQWNNIYKSNGEITTVCWNTGSQDRIVFATTKGICEAQLSQMTNEDGTFDLGLSATAGLGRDATPLRKIKRISSQTADPTQSPAGGQDVVAGLELQVQRQLAGVRKVAPHPELPVYVTVSSDAVNLWQFGQKEALHNYSCTGSAKPTHACFDRLGNRFGMADQDGGVRLWRFGDQQNAAPIWTSKCHSKRADAFDFVTSSLIVTGGLSNNGDNVVLWDTLVSPRQSLVKSFQISEGGCKSLAFLPRMQQLICGSRNGQISIIDLRQNKLLHQWTAHEGSVECMVVDEYSDRVISGCSDGFVKIFSLKTLKQEQQWSNVHSKGTFFRGGVQDLVYKDGVVISCGGDGLLRQCFLPL